jgi:hypothetical protein
MGAPYPPPAEPLLLQSTGSRFQQHLARETTAAADASSDGAAATAQLAVFAINPVDAAFQTRAICAGALPRLGVPAMVAACERLRLPWAGYIAPAQLLVSALDVPSGAAPLLPASLLEQLQVQAASSSSSCVLSVRSIDELEALRRCMLALDADDVEGAVPVIEAACSPAPSAAPSESTDVPLALFKFKVAIYYFRRRLREQLRRGVTGPQLPAMRASLEEWVVKAPRHRQAGLRRMAERVYHYAAATRLAPEDIDGRILDILEACGEPPCAVGACYAGCPLCDPAAQVPRTLVVTLPGQTQAVAAALAGARPNTMIEQWPQPAAAAEGGAGGGSRMTSGALIGWASGHSVLVADVTKLPLPLPGLLLPPSSTLGLQSLILLRPDAAHAADPALLRAAHPTNPRAAEAILTRAIAQIAELEAAAAVAAAAPDAPLSLSVATDAVAAAAAVRTGPRLPLPTEAAKAGATRSGGAASASAGTAAASNARPSSTRLVVFLIGVVGLGKTSLAHALTAWLTAHAPRPTAATAAAPPAAASAAAMDQDEFSSLGREGSRAAVLRRLHDLLDADTTYIIVHRNGPGSAPLLAALQVRERGGVCVVGGMSSSVVSQRDGPRVTRPFDPSSSLLLTCAGARCAMGRGLPSRAGRGGFCRSHRPCPCPCPGTCKVGWRERTSGALARSAAGHRTVAQGT